MLASVNQKIIALGIPRVSQPQWDLVLHVAPSAQALAILDQAGWHGSTELVVPPNIALMPLPPNCPELNPVENNWQCMRDNGHSNRIFKSYDDIVDHSCHAGNKLADQPWRIMSIGWRRWLMGHDQWDLMQLTNGKNFGENVTANIGDRISVPWGTAQGTDAVLNHVVRSWSGVAGVY